MDDNAGPLPMGGPDTAEVPRGFPLSAAATLLPPTQRLPRRGWLRGSPRLRKGQRIYAIGDVHGRYDLLRVLLERIEADHRERDPGYRSQIVLLGDVIDRGPNSRLLLRLLMAANQQTSAIELLLGNHEAALLDSLAGDAAAQSAWLGFGGLDTLRSYGIDPLREGEDPFAFADRIAAGIGTPIIEWLRDRPLSIRSGDYFFCHAGVRPGVGLARQSRDDLLWIRDAFLSSGRDHGAVVIHGHTIVDRVEIRPNRISIDTGAYSTHILSAIGLQDDQFWVIHTG